MNKKFAVIISINAFMLMACSIVRVKQEGTGYYKISCYSWKWACENKAESLCKEYGYSILDESKEVGNYYSKDGGYEKVDITMTVVCNDSLTAKAEKRKLGK